MEATELCPWCNSMISRDSFLEIEGKIRAEEKKKLATREVSIRETLQKQFAADYEKRQQVIERRLKAESESAVAKLTAERDAATRRLKDAEGREQAIRKQAKEEADRVAARETEKRRALLLKLTSERDAATEKLKGSEAREAEIRKEAKSEADKAAAKELEKHDRVLDKVIAELDAAKQSAKNAEVREAQIRKEVTLEAERAAAKERQKDREILGKERDRALLKQKSESNRQLEAVQKQLKIMERKVENKTANQLGEGAEIDLYEALRESFAEDRVTRVPKGQSGADLIHEVRYKGQCCGRIVIDSKNHQGWRDVFASKLREDLRAAGADHAILSSSAFHQDKNEMCEKSGALIVSPARVVFMVEVLRKSMISMYILNLSTQEKTDKTARLYKLITSDSYIRRFNEAMKVSEDILELDVAEQTAHSKVWRERGTLTKRMGNLLRAIDTDVASITEGTNADATLPAKLSRGIVSTSERQEAS